MMLLYINLATEEANWVLIYYCKLLKAIAYIVVDEVQVMSRCDSHRSSASFGNSGICLMQSLMNEYHSIDNGVSVCWWHWKVLVDLWDEVWRLVLE